MIMKQKIVFSMLFMLCFLSCTNKGIDFSYSPAAPKAGESVVFTNLTDKGDKWTWTFGDGTFSTLRNASKTYKKAGTYTVTLMVDSVKWKRVSKEVVIYDTIPSFELSSDSVLYMEEVTLSPLVYNPYNKQVSYEWELPDCAVFVYGDKKTAAPVVYFNRHDTTVSITMHLVFDGKPYDVKKEFTIHDRPAHGLYIATSEDSRLKDIYRYPLFDIGQADAEQVVHWSDINTPADGKVSMFDFADSTLLIFLEGNGQSLYSLDYDTAPHNYHLVPVVSGSNKLSRGQVWDRQLYWTSGKNRIFVVDPTIKGQSEQNISNSLVTLNSPHLFAGNFFRYNQRLIYSSTDSVAYCLIPSNASESQTPVLIYRHEQAIDQIAVDPTAQKIYIVSNGELTITNIDGSNPVTWEGEQVNTISLALGIGTLYFANDQGCYSVPLVHNQQNTITTEPQMLNHIQGVTALIYDSRQI